MYYAIGEKLLVRMKALLASDTHVDEHERDLLLQDLTTAEADPILSCLLWTKMDLVAEFRFLIHGANPRNPDGTLFQKAEPFVDPLRERLAMNMAEQIDEFCLGSRNDIYADIGIAAADTLRTTILESLEDTGLDQYDVSIPLDELLTNYFTCR